MGACLYAPFPKFQSRIYFWKSFLEHRSFNVKEIKEKLQLCGNFHYKIQVTYKILVFIKILINIFLFLNVIFLVPFSSPSGKYWKKMGLWVTFIPAPLTIHLISDSKTLSESRQIPTGMNWQRNLTDLIPYHRLFTNAKTLGQSLSELPI